MGTIAREEARLDPGYIGILINALLEKKPSSAVRPRARLEPEDTGILIKALLGIDYFERRPPRSPAGSRIYWVPY